MGMQIH